jgi:hypothetical protein
MTVLSKAIRKIMIIFSGLLYYFLFILSSYGVPKMFFGASHNRKAEELFFIAPRNKI